MSSRSIRVLDLFAGAGGLSSGLKTGSKLFETVRAVEIDPAAAASYNATFGDSIAFAGSIQDWRLLDEDLGRIDVVVGGPPCQGFSTLGKRDAEDERNDLWREYEAVIARYTPQYFLLENVAMFFKSSQFQELLESTQSGVLSDYKIEYSVLNSADYGTPQTRKRAVIIGYRSDMIFPGFPPPTHLGNHVSVRKALAGVDPVVTATELAPERTIEVGGRQLAGPFSPSELHLGRSYSKLSMDRFAAIPEGGNRFNLPEKLKAECWKKHVSGSGDVMGRMHWDRPSVTIRTEFFKPEKGRYIHPSENRAITHFEASILQGFSPQHVFVGSKTSIARQIGNAVPIPLGAALGKQVAAAVTRR